MPSLTLGGGKGNTKCYLACNLEQKAYEGRRKGDIITLSTQMIFPLKTSCCFFRHKGKDGYLVFSRKDKAASPHKHLQVQNADTAASLKNNNHGKWYMPEHPLQFGLDGLLRSSFMGLVCTCLT